MDIECFAKRFVHAYWEVWKEGEFSMPPNEPVEEELEELLEMVTYDTEPSKSIDRGYVLVMRNKDGDWWRFTFLEGVGGWDLVACSARSDNPAAPHDLLGPVYGPYFKPFLVHVAERANSK